MTGCLHTLKARSLRAGAGDDRGRIDAAFVRKCDGVAEQFSGADIAVLERNAIEVVLTFARNLKAGAGTLFAGIVDGAWVLVVAGCTVESVDTAAGRVATV